MIYVCARGTVLVMELMELLLCYAVFAKRLNEFASAIQWRGREACDIWLAGKGNSPKNTFF